jgi:hypothetical protein
MPEIDSAHSVSVDLVRLNVVPQQFNQPLLADFAASLRLPPSRINAIASLHVLATLNQVD